MGGSIVTNDLSLFGFRELKRARDLLDLMIEEGLPESFEDIGVEIMFNSRSGKVFITNDQGQVVMEEDGGLEEYFICNECGREGFKDDIGFNRDERLCEFCM